LSAALVENRFYSRERWRKGNRFSRRKTQGMLQVRLWERSALWNGDERERERERAKSLRAVGLLTKLGCTLQPDPRRPTRKRWVLPDQVAPGHDVSPLFCGLDARAVNEVASHDVEYCNPIELAFIGLVLLALRGYGATSLMGTWAELAVLLTHCTGRLVSEDMAARYGRRVMAERRLVDGHMHCDQEDDGTCPFVSYCFVPTRALDLLLLAVRARRAERPRSRRPIGIERVRTRVAADATRQNHYVEEVKYPAQPRSAGELGVSVSGPTGPTRGPLCSIAGCHRPRRQQGELCEPCFRRQAPQLRLAGLFAGGVGREGAELAPAENTLAKAPERPGIARSAVDWTRVVGVDVSEQGEAPRHLYLDTAELSPEQLDLFRRDPVQLALALGAAEPPRGRR
jgi:hypothetical protein